jgi:hypothetical protein
LAEGKHVGGVVYAVYLDALLEVVNEQTAGPTANIQDGLAVLADEVEIEEAVGPAGGVAAEDVPGFGD